MKLKLKEGTTSKIVTVFIQDSSSSVGAGLTGLVYNSGSLTAYWIAEGDATATAITLVTMTAGTWTSSGFKEVDATNMPGIYQLGLPNVVIDNSSEGSVVVMLKGATDMAPVVLEIELDTINYQPTDGFIPSNVKALNDSTTAALNIGESADTMIVGAAATGTLSTTEMTTDMTVTVTDQYNGRVLIFDSDTTTTALRGQATDITATSTTNGKLTFTALTTAPVNGDTFIIV